MSDIRVTLREPVAGGHGPEIARRLFFVMPGLVDFKLVERDGAIHEIVFTADRPLDAGGLAERVTYLIDNEIRSLSLMPRKVVWESPEHRPAVDVFGQLVTEGIAFETGEGQVGFGEPLIGLMDYLDSEIRQMVVDSFGAQEFRYPTLIPTRTLERCAYFSSFPQYLMFVTRLHSDTNVYRNFLQRYGQGEQLDISVLHDCANVDYCLPPTMCFHTFAQFAGRALADGGKVVTAKGKSFRFESRYATTLQRLWDFTIREIVFMGTREKILESRRHFMQMMFDFVADLGLTGFCEVANDPFFVNTDTTSKILSQRLLELKYELRLDIGAGQTVAVGSFNFHDTFFSQSFDIRRPDGTEEGTVAHSACAGFGLERFVYAFVCQYGLDRRQWPARVTSAIKQHKEIS
ncbi:MAG TPA: hypothetical protein VFC19_14345 [Candidatus Limnocylindrales bacterium]|nr:hypothetical protein [Candidatus Limnocylindrales bacterium]